MALNPPDGPLLVIGWDSASFELLDRFEDQLPNLSKLKRDGAYGTLRTVHPPGTIPGWPCITTGLNPGKINTQRLAPFRKEEFQPNTGEENIEIWDVVNEFGGTSCVVNIPTVVEAYDIDGAIVAGFMSTGDSTTVTPPELLDSLDVDSDLRIQWEEVDREADIFIAAMEIAETRFDLVTALMEQYAWDFFIVNFDAPDRIGHSRFKYIDPEHPYYTDKGHRKYGGDLQKAYSRLDEMLGLLVGETENVFVISDHGMEPCHYRFHINDWLIRNGYLVLEEGASGASPTLPTRVMGSLVGIVTRYGLIDYVPSFMKRKSIVGRLEQTRHISAAGVDWEATSAYMSAVYGGIDVIANDKSRIKTRLIDDLESIGSPSMTVIDSRDLYDGPNIDNVPDLFLEFDEAVLPTNQVGASALLEPASTGGKHSMNGVFAAAGPGIRAEGRIAEATVMDVAPTALHLLGLPIPAAVDGSVLEILSTERDPVTRELDIDLKKGRDQLSEQEKAEVLDTLEDIGYM